MRRNQQRAGVRYDALTPESIEYYMPTLQYSVLKKQSSKENDNCAVCLIEFENDDECRETICGHYFHKACLDLWLNKHENCPYCRAGLSRKDFEDKKTPIKKNEIEEQKQQAPEIEVRNIVSSQEEEQDLENVSSSEINSQNKSVQKQNRRSISQGHNEKAIENELQDFENMINLHSNTKRQSHQYEGGEEFKVEKSINQSFPEEKKYNQSINIKEQNFEDSFEAIEIEQKFINYQQKSVQKIDRNSYSQLHPQSSLLGTKNPQKKTEEDLEEINTILLNK